MTFAQYLSVNNNENFPNIKIHFIKLDPQFCLLLNLIVKIIQDFLISQSGKKCQIWSHYDAFKKLFNDDLMTGDSF